MLYNKLHIYYTYGDRLWGRPGVQLLTAIPFAAQFVFHFLSHLDNAKLGPWGVLGTLLVAAGAFTKSKSEASSKKVEAPPGIE